MIWVLTESVEYESTKVIGAFDNKVKACEAFLEAHKTACGDEPDSWELSSWTVNGTKQKELCIDRSSKFSSTPANVPFQYFANAFREEESCMVVEDLMGFNWGEEEEDELHNTRNV